MRVFKPIGSILIWLYGLHLRYWVTALLKISIGKIPVGFQNVLSFRYFDKYIILELRGAIAIVPSNLVSRFA